MHGYCGRMAPDRPLAHPHPDESDAEREARAKALSSPLRLRILRICLHEARTNKEIADVFGLNPGSVLHHVRSLIDTRLLAAEEPRRGARGSREIPYRATGLSFTTSLPNSSSLVVETFLQEIEGIAPDDLDAWRLGLKLSDADLDELRSRFRALFLKYAERAPDPGGTAVSLMFAIHPERQPRTDGDEAD